MTRTVGFLPENKVVMVSSCSQGSTRMFEWPVSFFNAPDYFVKQTPDFPDRKKWFGETTALSFYSWSH